ncbi:MAG: 50S ribosomal protein L11 methyltransferase [Hyphomonadaceae bacterium]
MRGARVADIGCGGGVVAIAAALAGAKIVSAIDIDPRAAIVARLNAEANGVVVNAITADAFATPAPEADIVLAGDVAYEAVLAHRALGWLRLCRQAGCQVLVGDPGRRHLPLPELVPLAHMRVPDFGAAGDGLADAAVYRLRDAS